MENKTMVTVVCRDLLISGTASVNLKDKKMALVSRTEWDVGRDMRISTLGM